MTPMDTFTTRWLDGEPDTIEIVPRHADYVIIGTYTNHKTSAQQTDQQPTSSTRTGTLQIIPFKASSNPPASNDPGVNRKEFSGAILDIRFHPDDESLLGAATSQGEMRFLRIIDTTKMLHNTRVFDFIELGCVCIEHSDDDTEKPLVTQFTWLPGVQKGAQTGIDDEIQVTLATCDTMGYTQTIRARLPDIETLSDTRIAQNKATSTPYETQHIHKQGHDLEAWTVASIKYISVSNNPTDPSPISILLTGGDDSTVIVSSHETPTQGPFTAPVLRRYQETRSHTAGVTAIHPLPARNPSSPSRIPILTGSYDDTLRLFFLSETNSRLTLTLDSEINLGGGVWRITLLDNYNISVDADESHHYILLVSVMYAGARIVRLKTTKEDGNWEFIVEKEFTEHESMVYACVGKEEGWGNWKILSSSFYDKRVCGWGWRDEVKVKTRE